MNEADEKGIEIERFLKKARLAEPSSEVKARVIGAAKEAWSEAPADASWRIGLRRLAISAAAAVVLVSSANYFSGQAVARWQAGPVVAAKMAPANFEDMPESPYSPFVMHLMATGRSPAQNAAALLDYVEKVRETLNGAEQDDAAERSGSGEHESRLLPVGSKIDLYS